MKIKFITKHPYISYITFFAILSIILMSLTSGQMYSQNRLPYIMNDFQFHVSRIQEYFLELQKGRIIPSGILTKTFGDFGYPLNSFYPIYMLIPEAFIHLFIENSWIAWQIFSTLILFLVFTSMFVCCKKIGISSFGSCFSAFIYGFSPISLTIIGKGFGIAYTISLIFFTLVLFGTYEIIFSNYKRFWILSFGIALLILTHVISAVVAFTLILFMILGLFFNGSTLKKNLKRLCYLIFAGILTLLLTMFFSLNLIVNMRFLGTGAIKAQNFSYLDSVDPLSFILGGRFFNVFALIAIFLVLLVFKKLRKSFKFLFIGLIFFSILSTRIFPWNLLTSFRNTLQSPSWRFMVVPLLLGSVLGGAAIDILSIKIKYSKPLILLFCLFIGFSLFFQQSTSTVEQAPKLSDQQASQFIYGTLTYKQFKQVSIQSLNVDYIPLKSLPIQNNLYSHSILSMNPHLKGIKQTHWSTSYNSIHYRITSKKSISKLALPNIYYPGFHAYVYNKEVPIHVGKQHQIEIPVKKGKDKINLIYRDTTLKIVSNIISAVTWIGLICYLLFRWVRNKFFRNKTEPRHAQ